MTMVWRQQERCSCKSIEPFYVESRSSLVASACLGLHSRLSFCEQCEHNVRFADQADLLRSTDKHTIDVPTHSETIREGGDSHAAERSSTMDRHVFPRSSERRGASSEGTFLFVQTSFPCQSSSAISFSIRITFPRGSIIHHATCAILCYKENLSLKKINIRILNFSRNFKIELPRYTLKEQFLLFVTIITYYYNYDYYCYNISI